MEHTPWLGAEYKRSEGFAIVGYSHYRDPRHADHPGFTRTVLRNVVAGSQRGDSFFTSVSNYFHATDRATFWNSVLFFNFVPRCIGTTEEKYKSATEAQYGEACKRFSRIIQREKPAKIFVFSLKAWNNCPPNLPGTCNALGSEFGRASWGRYDIGSRQVVAIGLQHPLYSNKVRMQKAVDLGLTLH